MKTVLALIAALTLSACAAPNPFQRFTFSSWTGKPADCTLSNDRGTWRLTTPGTVSVLKSRAPLKMSCTMPGYAWEQTIEGPNYSGNWSAPMQKVEQ